MQPTKTPGKWTQLWLDIKKNKVSYYFLAPFLILFTVFTIVPIIMSVVLSFSYYNIIETPRFIGFSNYKLLFVDDDIFLKAVGITLKFAIITGPIGYIMAFLLAWLISQIPQKFRFFYTLCYYVPSITSAVAMSVVCCICSLTTARGCLITGSFSWGLSMNLIYFCKMWIPLYPLSS